MVGRFDAIALLGPQGPAEFLVDAFVQGAVVVLQGLRQRGGIDGLVPGHLLQRPVALHGPALQALRQVRVLLRRHPAHDQHGVPARGDHLLGAGKAVGQFVHEAPSGGRVDHHAVAKAHQHREHGADPPALLVPGGPGPHLEPGEVDRRGADPQGAHQAFGRGPGVVGGLQRGAQGGGVDLAEGHVLAVAAGGQNDAAGRPDPPDGPAALPREDVVRDHFGAHHRAAGVLDEALHGGLQADGDSQFPALHQQGLEDHRPGAVGRAVDAGYGMAAAVVESVGEDHPEVVPAPQEGLQGPFGHGADQVGVVEPVAGLEHVLGHQGGGVLDAVGGLEGGVGHREQAAAERRIAPGQLHLLDDQHGPARAPGLDGRRQACVAGPHDQDVKGFIEHRHSLGSSGTGFGHAPTATFLLLRYP